MATTSTYKAPEIKKPKNIAQKVVSGVIAAVSVAFPPAGAIAAAVVAVTSVIGKIGDQKKRKEFEKAFSQLSNSNKVMLAKELAIQQNETRKFEILSNYLTAGSIENEKMKDAQLLRNYILLSTLTTAMFIAVVIIKTRKK